MKRPEAHDIDEAAQRIFQAALPTDWVPRKEVPDYGLDFVVEVFDQGETTGLRFAVQLKGRKRIRQKHGRVSCSLPTSNLADYVDKIRYPVFLFNVDVEKQRGYWVFLQQHALEDLKGKNWRKQETVTIHIPATNLMSNSAKLYEAVAEADAYMRALYPSSIQHALSAERERLQSLDPRIEIDMVASEHEAHCSLRAKEPIKLELTFKGREPDMSEKMDSLWNRGLPTAFGPGEIEVSGSALMEHVFSTPGVLQVANHIEASLRISAIDSSDEEIAAVDFQAGILECAPKECRFTGTLAGEIIRLGLTLPLGSSASSQPFTFTFAVNFQSWVGRPIQQLPYFSQCYRLFRAIVDGAKPKLVLSSLGNHIFGGFMQTKESEEFESIEKWLRPIHHVRQMARHFGIDPPFPEHVSAKELKDINLVHWMLFDRSPRCGEGMHLAISISQEGAVEFLRSPASADDHGPFALGDTTPEYEVFGERVAVGPLNVALTTAHLLNGRDDIRRQLDEAGEEDRITMAWEGTPDSQMSVEFLEPEANDYPTG